MQVKIVDEKSIGLFFEYNPKTAGLVKSLPGRSFCAPLRCWTIPFDGLTETSLNLLKKQLPNILIDERVWSRVEEFKTPILQNFESNLPLYPFQSEIAKKMVGAGNTLNASFCGSGKTITMLAVADHLKAQKMAVIAPKSVLTGWRAECEKWHESRAVFIATGAKQDRIDAYNGYLACKTPALLVLNYDILRLDTEQLFPMVHDVLVFDEIHFLCNYSKRTKIALKLKAKHKYGLSATPLMNRLTDVFYPITILRGPVLGNLMTFTNRYTVADYWGSVKYYKNVKELAARIEPFIVKKTIEEAGLEIPDKTETNIYFDLSENERRIYDLMKSELLFELQKIDINKIENPFMLQNTVVKLQKLMELTCSLELIGDSTESSKLDTLKEHLQTVLVNGNKAVVFCQYERMVQILGRELAEYQPLILTGAVQKRQELFDAFKNDPARRLFISTDAGGAGIDLSAASYLYNYLLPYSLGKLDQRIGRIWGLRAKKPIFIYNLIANKTIENWLLKKIASKKILSDSLMPKSFDEIKEILEP